ncbi:microtubule-associated protein futsch [Neodiprion virginianus]|uniref:microtubule-associated protein futsch n=1 Tax=Neodiprion virginianus TaxID=2961670 RepID=UPI001EE765C5|nr:microtubule-associated protein futsch [Neodiprion virginianus]
MSDRKNHKPKKLRKRSQDNSSSNSSESTSSASSDDESNAQNLKPIKDYLVDRRELARQLFIAVKGDKLRMMLPQVLKKMEQNELEEWCANELSGMSKARILSILNGQPLLQSSDSDDTDDSGPSLEIISDTEEWGDASDLDAVPREEVQAPKKGLGSKKDKPKSKLWSEKTSKEKAKPRDMQKYRVKMESDSKTHRSGAEVIVKKEAESEQSKEKDGESLLDLLELEMRARAIRALIRKEEDIIPTNSTTVMTAQSNVSNSGSSSAVNSKARTRDRNLSLKVVEDKLQELDTIMSGQTNQEIPVEEDVVLVLQPTTTIELLSSESDGEGGQGKRRNQRLENERVPKNGVASSQENSGGVGSRKLSESQDSVAREKSKASTEQNSSPVAATVEIMGKANVGNAEISAETPVKKVSTELETSRKFKRKTKDNSTTIEKSNPVSETQSSGKNDGNLASGVKEEAPKDAKVPESSRPEIQHKRMEEKTEIPLAEKTERKPEAVNPREIDEDKSTDLEIVIDLDDYPDDMEEPEPGEIRNPVQVEEKRPESSKDEAKSDSNAAETWATRYYQTEDVQSVIKESKIQSEIRKRLRERQRRARLNNSPGLNTAQNMPNAHVVEKSGPEKSESPTTGSVEEYLALRNVETVAPRAESAKSNEVDKSVEYQISDGQTDAESIILTTAESSATGHVERKLDGKTEVSEDH